ncbi:TRAP transporter small permease [candidate division KSB1 bacterium]|nr:TRAP transporter small permease [candidate division KSB1 bacterium]
MRKFTTRISKFLGIVLMILMAAMVLDVTWQVFTRFIMNRPSSFTEELAGFLLIWIGLLGASYAYYSRAHLGIDVLTYKLVGRKKQIVEILVNSIVLLFALFVMIIGGSNLVNMIFTLKQISPALGIEMGYIYLVIPIAGAFIIYYAIYFIVETLRSKPEDTAEHKIVVVE